MIPPTALAAALVATLSVLACQKAPPPPNPTSPGADASLGTLVLHDELTGGQLWRGSDGTYTWTDSVNSSVQMWPPKGVLPGPGEHIERACRKCTLVQTSSCPPGASCPVAAPVPVSCPVFGPPEYDGDGHVYVDVQRDLRICQSRIGPASCLLSERPGEARPVTCPAIGYGPVTRDSRIMAGCFWLRSHRPPLPPQPEPTPCPDLPELREAGDAATPALRDP